MAAVAAAAAVVELALLAVSAFSWLKMAPGRDGLHLRLCHYCCSAVYCSCVPMALSPVCYLEVMAERMAAVVAAVWCSHSHWAAPVHSSQKTG